MRTDKRGHESANYTRTDTSLRKPANGAQNGKLYASRHTIAEARKRYKNRQIIREQIHHSKGLLIIKNIKKVGGGEILSKIFCDFVNFSYFCNRIYM